MRTLSGVIFLLILSVATFSASGADLDLASVIGAKLGKKVDSVKSVDFADLYEVASEGNVIYVDKNIKHVFAGSVYDIEKKINLTKESIKKAQLINFDELPIKNSVQTIGKPGEKRIVVFADPNCKFCKKLEKDLAELKGVKILTFIYPILSEDSANISRDIWCSASPSDAWREWMLAGKKPKSSDCSSPNEANLLLGRKLHVNATPVMFFEDGDRISGAVPVEKIKEKLKMLN